MVLSVDARTTVVVSRDPQEPECDVCSVDGSTPNCSPTEKTLTNVGNLTLEFSCPKPQNMYSVKIKKSIDCTEVSCSGDIVQAESSYFPDFNRTFVWYLKVVSTRAFQLDFPEPGMRQIPNEETCPDEHTYSFLTYLRSGPAKIGTFCKGGTVKAILQILSHIRILFWFRPFSVMKRLHCVSDTAFITANYPGDFPDDQQMQWDFSVPGMHNYSVHFNDHTAPECLSKEVEVEYHGTGKKVTKLPLTASQPEHQQGSFSVVLKNCETNRTLPGLALNYRVSVMRSGHPVLCTVDLSKHKSVSLQLEKVGSDPYCEMSIDSQLISDRRFLLKMPTSHTLKIHIKNNIFVLYFDGLTSSISLFRNLLNLIFCLFMTACQNMASCPSSLLTVPKLDSCLPMLLHSFTWHLSIPQDGTLDLTSPMGSLRQSLPGQECNQSVSLHVAESDGTPVGDFCYSGAIQKIQAHTNISVTATVQDLKKMRRSFLNVSFSQEIPASLQFFDLNYTFIYRVSPTTLSPTLLATPNWPQGMRSSSTVSWIVTLPSQYRADVHFVNISQPKCNDRHTAIKVKLLGQEEEIMSRREDEQAEDRLQVPQSFYLNMSNCVPEEGQFGAVTKIVLQKKTTLAVLLLVLAVVCVITKKKKKETMSMESSIYIGRGNIFRPNDGHFPKTRSDNESHVYDSIDETMVYGHLLGDASYADSLQDHYNGIQVDSYQTFTGPSDGKLPVIIEPEADESNVFLDPSESFIPPRPRTPIDRQDSLGFQDSRMVDNELYTFKSAGDISAFRLSGADMEPQPPVFTEESL
uniref:Uncharacterized protein n=1 Tax=Mola mola TaxID=94237 RepID=A0A3Q3WW93_MOLML